MKDWRRGKSPSACLALSQARPVSHMRSAWTRLSSTPSGAKPVKVKRPRGAGSNSLGTGLICLPLFIVILGGCQSNGAKELTTPRTSASVAERAQNVASRPEQPLPPPPGDLPDVILGEEVAAPPPPAKSETTVGRTNCVAAEFSGDAAWLAADLKTVLEAETEQPVSVRENGERYTFTWQNTVNADGLLENLRGDFLMLNGLESEYEVVVGEKQGCLTLIPRR